MENTSISKKDTVSDWKVAALTTGIMFLQCGIQRAGSLYFVEFINTYNINREKASIPFTVFYIALYMAGPFIAYMEKIFQLRSIMTFGAILSSIGIFANFWANDVIFLTIFWGVLFGTGGGIGLSLLLEIINRHFEKYLSTAIGIYFAGASIGAAILPYLSKALIEYYGLAGALLILGGIALHAIPLSLALPVYQKSSSLNKCDLTNEQIEHDDPKEIASQDKNIFCISHNRNYQKGSDEKPSILSPFRILFNPTFIVIGIAYSCFLGITAALNLILIDYCLEKGVTQDEGVYVLMSVSLTDLVGRVGLGWITDCGFISVVNFLTGSYIALGLSCLLFIWSGGFMMYMVSSVVYGTFFGVVVSYSPMMFNDYIDPEDRTMAVSSRNIFFTPVCVATPYILGYFKDKVRSYDGLMYALAAISILAAVLTLSVPHIAKQQEKLKQTNPTEQLSHCSYL